MFQLCSVPHNHRSLHHIEDPNQGLEYQDLDRANERNQEFTEGPYPDNEANEEPEIVHEDEETIVIRSGEQRRELKKIPGENQTCLAEVNAVTDENVFPFEGCILFLLSGLPL